MSPTPLNLLMYAVSTLLTSLETPVCVEVEPSLGISVQLAEAFPAHLVSYVVDGSISGWKGLYDS